MKNNHVELTAIFYENPYYGNSASCNRYQSLLDGLSKHGMNIKIIITGGFQNKQEFRERKFNRYFNTIYVSKLYNGNIWFRRINKYIVEPLISIIVSKVVVEIIKKRKPDFIWIDTNYYSLKITKEIKENTNSFIFTEISEFLNTCNYAQYTVIQKIYATRREKYFNEVAINCYDSIVLMTRTLIKHFKNNYPNCPYLLHLPMTVDLDRFKEKETSLKEFLKPYIVFIGAMDDSKEGISILINAFNIIKNEFSDYKLYLLGPWNYDTPSHIELIKELKLTDKVHWLGEYKRDQIPNILLNANLVVLPRPDSKQAQGGFPTKLGEYLATGNPVCATSVGEIPDYLVDGESVFFANPGSAVSFADAMRRALNNLDKAKSIGSNGRKVAEIHFNKDVQAKKLSEFLLSTNKE